MAEIHSDTSPSMRPRELLNGPITYSDAREYETNVLHELDYVNQETEYITSLYHNREKIQSIAARHFGSSPVNRFHIADPDQWMRGSFNVCIRIDFDAPGCQTPKQLIMRFPLPYKIGEISCPGNSDEKIRCEAGTYMWLQENCPDVPIPSLYGFGLASGKTVCVKPHRVDRISYICTYQPSLLLLTIGLSSHAQWRNSEGRS